MATLDDFIGRWKLVESDGFEEYMKAIGVGIITRKAAAHLKPTVEILKDGDTWHWNQYSTFKNTKLTFKLGEEFEDHSPDDKTYRSVLVFKDGKLIQSQNKIREQDHSSVFTSWLDGDLLISTYESGGVVCRRVFKKE
ncbi:unnamed protein product [Caenorhabditis sp. 36 PRJEB53466]|nr:unnamed protein product [Caenorhabditis sp. 36 PRJEB53466]